MTTFNHFRHTHSIVLTGVFSVSNKKVGAVKWCK